MQTWVRRSLNAGAFAAGAVLAAGAAAHADSTAHADTAVSAGNSGILNGTQLLTPVQIPIDVCGNAVAVAGSALATGGCATALHPDWTYARYREDVAVAASGTGPGGRHRATESTTESTADVPPAHGTPKAPKPPKTPRTPKTPPTYGPPKPDKPKPVHPHQHTTLFSTDNAGVLNGTQVYAPAQIPINICGNAIAVAGSAVA
jgi:hypothetical protein